MTGIPHLPQGRIPAGRPNVVFLDVDGVLNSSRWWRESRDVPHVDSQIDPRAVALFNEIAPAATTRIVVSSTWRLMGLQNVRAALERVGVAARIIDVTCELHEPYPRGKEIALWLKKHAHRIGNYVVIDDDFDAGLGHDGRFVKTDVREGLTRDAVEQAKRILASHSVAPRSTP